MLSTKKKVETINVAAKEIISHVIDVCDKEAATGELRVSLKRKRDRVADYTGISCRTVSKIRKECRKAGNSKLPTPGTRRALRMSKIAQLDYLSVHIIRNIISDFYLFKEGKFNSSVLLQAVKEKVDFPGGLHVLRKLLDDMGFRWKKCRRRRSRILVERPYITLWRFRYLKSMKKAQEENRNIIYISESWVDKSLIFKKCWYNADSITSEETINYSNRLIIFHACKETGFIENVQLILKANEISGDYNGHMNYETYEKWLTEKFLPNIPQNSVIVLDNSPYNSIERNKIPSKYASKTAMISWLEKNGVLVSPNMYKSELFNLINKYKSNKKVYVVDEMLKAEGHTILRLPPYMCVLNPAEFAWEKVESKVRQKSLKEECPFDIKMTVIEAINSVTAKDWEWFYKEVIKMENDYSNIDEALEPEMDKFICNLINSESSNSDSDSDSELA